MQRRAFEVTADWDDVEEEELEPPALNRLGEIVVPVLVLVGGLDLDARARCRRARLSPGPPVPAACLSTGSATDRPTSRQLERPRRISST